MIRTSEQKKVGLLTSHILLNIGAISYRPECPYILTSGWVSPLYVDCRKVISYPYIRRVIIQLAVWVILREIGNITIDAIAGGETAGIPYAAWIAEELNLPMLYIRKQSKGFGQDSLIEGRLVSGQSILLVEDLITDGVSKVRFCEILRESGAIVHHTMTVFSYEIFPKTAHTMRNSNLYLHYLTNWWDVLEVFEKKKTFDEKSLGEIRHFLYEPALWSEKHGGKFR